MQPCLILDRPLAPAWSCAPQLLSLYSCYARMYRPAAVGHRRRCWTAARRQSKEEMAAGEWAALLGDEEQAHVEEGVTVEQLNQLCNRGVKLMLDENVRELQDFRDELNAVGQAFTDDDNLDGAKFIYALYMMSEHVIVDQAQDLKGIYADAFTRVFGLLEDSGWRLEREGEQTEAGAPTLDDIPSLGYFG